MGITLEDILALEPSTVSRDLSSYLIYIYGSPKVGKTTLAKDMGALILSCEDGTRAMTGAYSQIIKSWGDIKAIVRYAKDPKFKAKYKAIAVDTVDVAVAYCEKYICQQADVDALNKVPYGGGWSRYKKEFEEVFRTLALEGYAILFISHDKQQTITKPNGDTYTKTIPTVSESLNRVVMNMCDLIGYAYQEDDSEDRYLILRGSNSVTAGTRFPYMDSKIKFSHDDLVKALNDAIDEEERHSGSNMITTTKAIVELDNDYDYEALMEEFQNLVGDLMTKDQSYYAPRITQIVEKIMGKGKKVSEASIDQAELIYYIIKEIKEELVEKKTAKKKA